MELEDILAEALREARNRRPPGRCPSPTSGRLKTALDYSQRLAKKRLFRRLLGEPEMDAVRFQWWFTHQGGEGLTLDEWRRWIDSKISKDLALVRQR